MNRNDVESTGVDRYLRVRNSDDRVVEVFPAIQPLCPGCKKPVGSEPYLLVLKSKRYPINATVHWDCYNDERI